MEPKDQPCVVITGASSGVGKSAARVLAEQGWHVIAHGRDAERSAAALAELRAAASPNAQIDMVLCDLTLLSDTARMADEIAELTPRIDVLINNAGGVRDHMELTSEGNEITFAGNHLGHFLLTKRLMSLLQATAARTPPGTVRILATSSEGHKNARPFDWDDLQGVTTWVTGRNYCTAKLCNMLFTRELARRGAPLGIVANAIHPGEAKTNFAAHAEPWMARMVEQNDVSPDVGGDTLAWLASAPEMRNVTGGYFYEREQLELEPMATDDANAARLWEESEKLLARSGF